MEGGAGSRRRIAVVVPTLGRSPLLAACLAALERQRSHGLGIEILVVAQAGAAVPEGQRRVLAVPQNLGFAAATNLGLATAREAGDPELVATVNDDVVVEPGWAQHLVAALDADPRAAAAQGVNLLLEVRLLDDGDPRLGEAAKVADGCGLAWNRWWQAVQIGRGEPPPPPEAPPREIFGVSATAAIYRSAPLWQAAVEAAREGGPFDPGLESYYEDVELACRLRRLGATALLVPAARASHAGSLTGAAMPVARWRWIYGNRWLVLARLLGRRFTAELPRIAARDLVDLAAALATGRGRQSLGILAGWGRAARRLPAWAHRGASTVPMAELERFRVESRG